MCIACDGYLVLLLLGRAVADWVHGAGQVGVLW